MAEITAALVKDLREKTGAGMMDCKKALGETAGNIEEAVDWLRKKGLAAAAKKSGRVAAEGLVAVAANGTSGAVIELNSETDFVARNEHFQSYATEVAGLALSGNVKDVDALKALTLPSAGKNVGDALTSLIATIGENMNLRRATTLSVSNGVVSSYVHNALGAGLGKIGVLVALESTADAGKLNDFARQLAMHIAASKPEALSSEDVPAADIEREKAVHADKARASGKPEAIIEKMVDGSIRKYFEAIVLLEQFYIMDDKMQVKDVIAAKSKELGAPITLKGFVRYGLGEGIEKEETDFAAEVAATLGQ